MPLIDGPSKNPEKIVEKTRYRDFKLWGKPKPKTGTLYVDLFEADYFDIASHMNSYSDYSNPVSCKERQQAPRGSGPSMVEMSSQTQLLVLKRNMLICAYR